MSYINELLNNTEIIAYIVLGLVLTVVILIVLVIVLFRTIGSLEKKYRRFMRGVDNKDIEKLVIGYLDKVDEATNMVEQTRQMCKDIDFKLMKCIQKISIVRYKAFEDIGADLSFSIALLDDNNDGVILTGIYGRNESTTYAKPIDKGLSRYDMSDEEKQVLQDAINKN